MLLFVWEKLDPADLVFLTSALVGATFFILRAFFSLFLGAFEDHDTDTHHGDVEPEFKLLTMHSLTGFLMIFGLIGLGFRHHMNSSVGQSLIFAIGCGLLMMVITAAIFYMASRLTSRGTVFRIEETVGKPATVYMRIEPHTDGKIQITIRGMMRELGARTKYGETLESFSHVRVTEVIDGDTVFVEQQKNQ